MLIMVPVIPTIEPPRNPGTKKVNVNDVGTHRNIAGHVELSIIIAKTVNSKRMDTKMRLPFGTGWVVALSFVNSVSDNHKS